MSLLLESSVFSFIFVLLLFTDELLTELDSGDESFCSDFFSFRERFVGPTFKADFLKSLFGSFELEGEDDLDDCEELIGGSSFAGERDADKEDLADFSGEMLLDFDS